MATSQSVSVRREKCHLYVRIEESAIPVEGTDPSTAQAMVIDAKVAVREALLEAFEAYERELTVVDEVLTPQVQDPALKLVLAAYKRDHELSEEDLTGRWSLDDLSARCKTFLPFQQDGHWVFIKVAPLVAYAPEHMLTDVHKHQEVMQTEARLRDTIFKWLEEFEPAEVA